MCVVENQRPVRGHLCRTNCQPDDREKYLNDTIAAKQEGMEESMADINLIPPLMLNRK